MNPFQGKHFELSKQSTEVMNNIMMAAFSGKKQIQGSGGLASSLTNMGYWEQICF